MDTMSRFGLPVGDAAAASAPRGAQRPRLSLGEARTATASAPSAGKGGQGKGKGKGCSVLTTKLVLQLDARLREVESVVTTTSVLPAGNAAAASGKLAGQQYAQAVRDQPDHNLGSPHLHVFSGLLDGISASPPPTDAGAAVRWCAIKGLQRLLDRQDVTDASKWVRACRVTDMFAKKGVQPRSRVVLAFQGTVALPSAERVARALQVLGDNNATGEEVSAELGAILVDVEGVPESPVGKGVAVERLVTTCLCMLGGERTSGRAPTGALAYRLRRRGAAPAAEEDDEDM